MIMMVLDDGFGILESLSMFSKQHLEKTIICLVYFPNNYYISVSYYILI